MGLWDRLKKELIDIVEWVDDSNDTMVYRFERYNNEIKYGAKLVVRESQVAGKFLDPADPRFPSADLDCAVNIDRFDFALPVRRQEGQLVMEPGPHSPALVAQAQVCPAASTGDLAFSTARHAGHGPAASICHSVKRLCTSRDPIVDKLDRLSKIKADNR